MKTEISVIVPFYSEFHLLKRAINSVLRQSFKNYEIIVVYDNPSQKKNLIDLKKFLSQNSKIKLIVNKINIGAGYSRNRAIKIAKGRFIAFLDSDDFWKKNKLFLQYYFMKKNNLSATHTSYDVIDHKNKFKKKRFAVDLSYSDLLNSCDIGLSTVMLQRKLLSRKYNFVGLKTKEDYVLWLKIAKKGIIFKAINKSLSCWTSRPGSLSSSIGQKLIDAFRVYSEYEKLGFIESIKRVLILSFNFLKKM
jgi:teichuronic acid biosynthesis glycosyltransferase TuaG